ncbi:MAG TPA: ATP-binding protein, partial [Opitutaceae bacterium]
MKEPLSPKPSILSQRLVMTEPGESLPSPEPTAEIVLSTLAEGIVMISPEWKLTYVNSVAEKIIGHSRDALLGQFVWQKFPIAAGTLIQEMFESAKEKGEPQSIEYHAQSIGHTFQLKAYPSKHGLTIVFNDITAHTKRHAAQLVTEERFRLAAANPYITLYEQDRDLRYSWLYPLHDEHAHALGKTDDELSRPGTPTADLAAFKREVMSSGVEMRREFKIKIPAGLRYYDVFVSPRRNDRGEIIGVAGAAFDITQRKQVEEELRLLYRLMDAVNRAAADTEIYEAALDALCLSQGTERSAILLWDNEGVMRFVASRGLSESYRKAVDGHSPWTQGEPHAKPICIENVTESDLTPELRATILGENIRSVVFVPLKSETRLLGKFMVYFSEPKKFSRAQIQVCETIAQQVGVALERQRASQALEALVTARTASLQEAIHQMEEFSYTVSHDLRSPLRAMIAYSETMIEDYAPKLDGEISSFLDKIVKNARRMDLLVRDTLAYSRVARRDLTLSAVSLDQVIQEVLASLEHINLEKATVTVANPLGTVIGHDALLVQAVSNLVSNAIKFVAPEVRPCIAISSSQHGDCIRLAISDNGIGVPPKYQSRLFQIFERLNPNSGYEGTGIGLAIVRKAIERMAGKVGIVSD